MLQVFLKGVIDGAWKVFGKGGRPHFFAEVNSKICRHVFVCVCLCVCVCVCVCVSSYVLCV